MTAAVSLEDVGKRYVKYDDVPLLLTRALRFRAGHRRTHLWALRHIELEVKPGESHGVIGRNGSGKSTMFRMLAGVTAPTEGTVRVNGRVAPLISIGVGFHHELTGRENVYVNGIVLGLTKREIDRRFDAIVDFAQIEEFIDTPVKFYSSGMFVRLGFSVAVAADPEVLLVDEVLAVGDLAFQRRCFDRMEEIRRGGATVMVVSHNMNSIRRLCDRTTLLHNGVSLFTGKTDEAISRYHDALSETDHSGDGEDATEISTNFTLLDAQGDPTAHVRTGDEVIFSLEARFSQAAEHPAFAFRIDTDAGQLVYADNTAERDWTPVEAGGMVRCNVRLRAPLPTGSYIAEATVVAGLHEGAARAKPRPVNFFVSGRPIVKGAVDLGASFEVSTLEDPSVSRTDGGGRSDGRGSGPGPAEVPLARPGADR